MRLIDILNLIAKGELKEGSIVNFVDKDYPESFWYKDGYLFDKNDDTLEDDYSVTVLLNEEVEVIVPKCDMTTMDHIGESDKKVEKIEELDIGCTTWNDLYTEQKADVLFDKLNEVIRELNRRSE